ncbi:hypothetical protein HZH68_008439 [Vespula germanica]|uniref:Uncharacterized protein n=1 Tax=Vespula germanica TaxID=30212 RepID=A0A834N5P4_VESGE|nr:hypothetical protein HZH68_008439 [Vespula germanica]
MKKQARTLSSYLGQRYAATVNVDQVEVLLAHDKHRRRRDLTDGGGGGDDDNDDDDYDDEDGGEYRRRVVDVGGNATEWIEGDCKQPLVGKKAERLVTPFTRDYLLVT